MTTTLPPLHARLALRADGLEWQSRVEAVEDGTLTLARPFDVPIDGGPAQGATLDLAWAEEGAAFHLPVRLVRTVRDGLVALWVVVPQGAPTRDQRRAHFRLTLDTEARLDAGEQTLTAHLVDASEAALRLRVDPAVRLTAGAEVTASFEVRGEPFEASGTVLRSWPSVRADGEAASDVVVTLDVDERQAQELRRVLMAEQVRLRRLARD